MPDDKIGGSSVGQVNQQQQQIKKEGKRLQIGRKGGQTGATSAEFLNAAKSYMNKAGQQQGVKAYQHEHFNAVKMDSNNMGQSGAKLMRGDPSILDLKKVVLTPPPDGIQPDPTVVGPAITKMGVTGELSSGMGDLLGQQAAWASSKNMTVEKLKARQAELERQVALRKQALKRMAKAGKTAGNATLEQASWAIDDEDGNQDDPLEAGGILIDATKQQAEMLHKHLAKMMGVTAH